MKPISASRIIDAPAQKIFDVLADPKMHPVIDGGGTVRRARDANPQRLSLGARFGMSMRLGTPYRIVNTVVEFEEGKRIGWRHFARNVWRYELEPVDRGTRVTETFDPTGAPPGSGPILDLLGFRKRNRAAIEATLERLEAQVTKA